MPRTHARDLVGSRFGRLVVLAETDDRAANGQIIWRCRCDCGQVVAVITSNLTRGNTLSCGCYQREVSSRPNDRR